MCVSVYLSFLIFVVLSFGGFHDLRRWARAPDPRQGSARLGTPVLFVVLVVCSRFLIVCFVCVLLFVVCLLAFVEPRPRLTSRVGMGICKYLVDV